MDRELCLACTLPDCDDSNELCPYRKEIGQLTIKQRARKAKYMKVYRENHKKVMNETQRRYYYRHREKRLQYQRNYYTGQLT